METIIAVVAFGMVIALVLVTDRQLRTRFRQESTDTLGRKSRLGRPGKPRPLGEVIDEVMDDAAHDGRSNRHD